MTDEAHWQRWRLILATIVLGVSGLLTWLVFGGDGASECSEAWGRIPTSLDDPTDHPSYSSVVDLCSDRQLRDELEAWISRRRSVPSRLRSIHNGLVNRHASTSEAVPRMVIVPAWGTPDGPWMKIRDTWPGPVITFWGAGLRGEAVDKDWTLASDVNALSEMIDEHDVVCGAGWAASTVLLASRTRRPRLLILYSPPIGTDLAAIAEQVRGNPQAGKELMSSFGGAQAYWDVAVRAANFNERALAYLTQRVLDLGAGVSCPVVVVTPEVHRSPLPKTWIARSARPDDLAVEALTVLRSS